MSLFFIMHDHTKRCLSCRHVEHWTAIYQPMAEGAGTKLIPVRDPLPENAIIQKRVIPDSPIPVCRECLPRDFGYEKRAADEAERWAETIRRKRGEALLPSETRRFETSKGRAPASGPKPITELA